MAQKGHSSSSARLGRVKLPVTALVTVKSQCFTTYHFFSAVIKACNLRPLIQFFTSQMNSHKLLFSSWMHLSWCSHIVVVKHEMKMAAVYKMCEDKTLILLSYCILQKNNKDLCLTFHGLQLSFRKLICPPFALWQERANLRHECK